MLYVNVSTDFSEQMRALFIQKLLAVRKFPTTEQRKIKFIVMIENKRKTLIVLLNTKEYSYCFLENKRKSRHCFLKTKENDLLFHAKQKSLVLV